MTHSNQRDLITAAASGIGLAMADAFMAAGARVFICDVNAAALQATLAARPSLAVLHGAQRDSETVRRAGKKPA